MKGASMRRKPHPRTVSQGACLLEGVAIGLAGLTVLAALARLDRAGSAACATVAPAPIVRRAAPLGFRTVDDPVLQDMLLHD